MLLVGLSVCVGIKNHRSLCLYCYDEIVMIMLLGSDWYIEMVMVRFVVLKLLYWVGYVLTVMPIWLCSDCCVENLMLRLLCRVRYVDIVMLRLAV